VQVIQVLYGGTQSQYLPNVWNTAPPSLAAFYGGVTNSTYVDWLVEYNTPASGGTHQIIGRGSFLVQTHITPSSANDGAVISDAQLQNELAAQIMAGNLPAPLTDAAGHSNAAYMINFPSGKAITLGTLQSCSPGGFCGYHESFVLNGKGIYYGVLPDMQAPSPCNTSCGADASTFNNQTAVASHELAEVITDPQYPTAWIDSSNGEIGDICQPQHGTIVGGDGVTYVVQKEFSNVANDCIVTRTGAAPAPAIGDFTLLLAIALGLAAVVELRRRAAAAVELRRRGTPASMQWRALALSLLVAATAVAACGDRHHESGGGGSEDDGGPIGCVGGCGGSLDDTGATSGSAGSGATGGGEGSGSANSGAMGKDGSPNETGSVGLHLSIAPNVNVYSLNWTITGPNAYSGTVPIGDAQAVDFLIGGVAAGSGYTIAIGGSDSSGDLCSGTSLAFSVYAGAVTDVDVQATCVVASDAAVETQVSGGSVELDAGVNLVTVPPYACPGISSFSISPADLQPGQLAQLGVATVGTTVTRIQWSARGGSGGQFSDANAASPTFRCSGPGVVTVSVQLEYRPDGGSNVCNGVANTSFSDSIRCE
jgi:hypothetical protein